MKVLIVGDVHGCFNTLKTLVEDHWNKKDEFLVLAGDIINKGPHSFEALSYFIALKKEFPYQVFLLRGNHEQDFLNTLNSNKTNGYKNLIHQLKADGMGKIKLTEWLSNLPYKWENPCILITHAGVSEKAKHPYSATSAHGVLYNRNPLKRLDKVQVHGHDILNTSHPIFNGETNSWNVDTGAWKGEHLSAIRLSRKGNLKEIIQIEVDAEDFKP